MNWLNFLISTYPNIMEVWCVSPSCHFPIQLQLVYGVMCGVDQDQTPIRYVFQTECTTWAESVINYKFNNRHNWGTTYVFIKKKATHGFDKEYTIHMSSQEIQKWLWPLYGIINNLILIARRTLWRYYETSGCISKIIFSGPLTLVRNNWNE